MPRRCDESWKKRRMGRVDRDKPERTRLEQKKAKIRLG
jgi:hypothetical protein